MLSETQFMETYNPINKGSEGEYMMDDHAEAVRFAEARGLSHKNVWTIIESGEDETLYVSAGFHLVNRLGYIVTEKPWETALEEGVWMEDDFDRDLFESPEDLPENVQSVIEQYTTRLEEGDEDGYAVCKEFEGAMNALGYAFEYGLDAVPYGLVKSEA